MIEMVQDEAEIRRLNSENITDGKIKSILRAYGTETRFCGYYRQGGSVIMANCGADLVISQNGDDYDAEELSFFMRAHGIITVLLSTELMKKLEPFIDGDVRYNNVMSYIGPYIPAEVDENPLLDDVYEVLKSAFNIEYDSWYVDASHRIRHGVSKCYLLNGATSLTVLYDDDDTVFITLVGTIKSEQGKGYAKKLLQSVCGKYRSEGKRCLLVCKKTMRAFYEKCGFEKAGEIAQCTINKRNKG